MHTWKRDYVLHAFEKNMYAFLIIMYALLINMYPFLIYINRYPNMHFLIYVCILILMYAFFNYHVCISYVCFFQKHQIGRYLFFWMLVVIVPFMSMCVSVYGDRVLFIAIFTNER